MASALSLSLRGKCDLALEEKPRWLLLITVPETSNCSWSALEGINWKTENINTNPQDNRSQNITDTSDWRGRLMKE